MTNQKRRVVVTGYGIIGPIGHNVPDFWNDLKKAKCTSATIIDRFDSTEFKVHFACEIKNFDPNTLFTSPKEARKADRGCWYALKAAREAWEMSGLEDSDIPRHRIGCVIGTGMGGLETMEQQMDIVLTRGPSRVSPFCIPKIIPNMQAGMVSIDLGIKGPNFCVSSACASSAHAIGEVFHAIQLGMMDAAICGGSEACVTRLAVAGFGNMMALSMRNDAPEKSSRPFDADRDGFILSEGAGIVALEALEMAKARGAKILGEIVGYGASGDAYHITSPAPAGEGGANGMRFALEDAGLKPEDVDYINAHGTSTPLNDKLETIAIKSVFGDHAYKLAVSSTKGVTGHMLGAAGVVEAIISIKAIEEGVLPCTVNYETPDPDCDLDYVPNEWRKADVRVAISNSLGFGGANATLAFKRYE